jgi:hypothetical protein
MKDELHNAKNKCVMDQTSKDIKHEVMNRRGEDDGCIIRFDTTQ